jgi:hypothetical protein
LYDSSLRSSFLENKPSELNLGAVCYVAEHGGALYGLLECSNIDIRLFIIKNLNISEYVLNPELVTSGELTQELSDTRVDTWTTILDGKYPDDRMFRFEMSFPGPRVLNKNIMSNQIPSDDTRAEFLCVKIHDELLEDKLEDLKAGLRPVDINDFISEENE